jgi:hypothetical protein
MEQEAVEKIKAKLVEAAGVYRQDKEVSFDQVFIICIVFSEGRNRRLVGCFREDD